MGVIAVADHSAICSEGEVTTNLNKINLVRANLKRAKLSQIDLQEADLYKAKLQEANLFKINLRSSLLFHTDISGANLSSADFSNTIVDSIQYKKTIKIFKWIPWTYDTLKHCRGINVSSCSGNAVFKRHVMDQDYLGTFKEEYPFKYRLWKISSNCGQSMALWILWSTVFAFFFAGVFYGLGIDSFYINPDGLKDFKFFNILYYSVVTFTTLGFGDIIPKNTTAAIWVMAEVITGYMMLGGLISIFATKLARRS